jgi:hypothetical protein
MLLMKLDWSQPLSFQLPAGTKTAVKGWVLVDLPLGNFTPEQAVKFNIHEITDPALIEALGHLDYSVRDDGCVTLTGTVGDHTDDVHSLEDHMMHFPEIDPVHLPHFLAGYKYISKLECQAHYDQRFVALSPAHSSLEASTWPQQLAEAQAYQSNPAYPTPLLSILAQGSGMSVADLAQRAIDRNNSYEGAKASLLAEMIGDQLEIDNCSTPLEVKQLGWF